MPAVFENTKGIIRSRKSMKDRQHHGQKKKDKQRSTKHNICICCLFAEHAVLKSKNKDWLPVNCYSNASTIKIQFSVKV
jgi:hypothetical protein